MALTVEIRSGEGGADAKSLVDLQFEVYVRLCGKRCL
jgi:protein subunit release factor B